MERSLDLEEPFNKKARLEPSYVSAPGTQKQGNLSTHEQNNSQIDVPDIGREGFIEILRRFMRYRGASQEKCITIHGETEGKEIKVAFDDGRVEDHATFVTTV